MTEALILQKDGFYGVNIRATSVSISFNNALRVQDKGTKKTDQGLAAPLTKITDKKKYAIKLVVKGYLSEDEVYPNYTALQKSDFITSMNPASLGMLFKKGEMTLVYRSNSYVGAIETLKIDDDAIRLQKGLEATRLSIQFTFVYGTVK